MTNQVHRPFPDPERLGCSWSEWLEIDGAEERAETARLRTRTSTGKPCGDPQWVREVEQRLNKNLTRPRGRPRKPKSAEDRGGETPCDLFGG